MQPKKFTGKLIAIDMYNCGVNEVNDTERLCCRKAAMNTV